MNKLEMLLHFRNFYYERYFFHGHKAIDWKHFMQCHDKVIALMKGMK